MTDKLIEALVKAQSEINHAVQDADNPFFKSDYASLKSVIDGVKPHLNENGIYMQQISHDIPNGCCVETVFYGHGGTLSSGKVSIPATKNDPQQFGSALSYAKRYSLQMACGIATQKEDDDAEKAMLQKQGRFKVIGDDGETVISHSDDPNTFFQQCRDAMGNPDNVVHQKTYAASKWSIKAAAQARTKKEVKAGFEKMIALYEGAEPENQDAK